MLMHRSKLIAAASVVVTAGTLAVTGLTAASASAPAARPSASGIERFQLMTSSATSNEESIIALGGVFTAGGVDHQGTKVDLVVFPGGTFRIRHSNGTGTQSFNPKTCLTVINLHGTYRIGHGTGRYQNISGHGKYQLHILLVTARNAKGQCTTKKAPRAFQQLITARGPVKL